MTHVSFNTTLFHVQNILLSDTSSEDDDDNDDVPVTEAELKTMLKEHVRSKRYQKHFYRNQEVSVVDRVNRELHRVVTCE